MAWIHMEHDCKNSPHGIVAGLITSGVQRFLFVSVDTNSNNGAASQATSHRPRLKTLNGDL